MELSDPILDHLREVVALPDLSETKYVLEAEIGRGGLGVVYRARDCELDRAVAIKVVEADFAPEARIIARLEHPAIVPVYDSGVLPDGRVFYAMKLITGTRLDRYAAGPASLASRLDAIRRVGEALAFAHSRGAIHRDLKPQNVMVGEFGEVYVMDWGVEQVAGTAEFRAPEALLDRQSDIYSLGALMQFLLPQRCSPALRAIAAKAMSPHPEKRYLRAEDFLADLERFQDGRAVDAWSEPLWHKLQRFGSANAVLLWLLAAYAGVRFLLLFLRPR
jgi:predicted Ser/Thr protein kinase